MERMLRRMGAALAVAALLPSTSLAQETPESVSGQVTAATTGEPLSGVQVVASGTRVGTLTDGSGRYTIEVPAGVDTLAYVMLGYTTRRLPITGPVMNVQLTAEAIGLEGIVVTALGLEQQERSVSTSIAEIDGSELMDAPESNLVNALAGEASGVYTTGGGPTGGSARIVLRGATSLSGNNQPLFVVDGIPIDNSAPDLNGYGGFDYGNAVQDLNPADIASVTILKGPNAAALYGSRAANGVILVTTKTGAGIAGTQVTFNSSTMYEEPLRLPDFQNQYGQGLFGEFAFVDGEGGGTYDFVDESWGPPLDQGLEIPQFFSDGQPAPWVSHPDNVSNFWENGLSTYNNIAMSTSTDLADLRLSVSNRYTDAMYPGQQDEQWTVAFNGTSRISEKFGANASINYLKTEGNNRPGIGYDPDNPGLQFIWFGRQVDMDRLRDYERDGDHFNWNYSYHTNPYWIALKNENEDERDRIIGNVELDYDLAEGLSAVLRTGTDWYQEDRLRTFWEDGINYPYTGFFDADIERRETNTDLLVNLSRELTTDWSLSATVGANHRDERDNTASVFVEELTIPGVFTPSNSARPVVAEDFLYRRASNSLYGRAQFGFRDFLFVEATGRNDWSSTLPEDNNSYFYPSVSGSFIFTDAFDLGSDILTLGKIRASWARVGDDAEPYQLQAVYNAQSPFNGIPAYAVPNEIANENLKPEQTEAWEVGTYLSFLGGRLNFEGAYYDQVTRDQILATAISATSGFEEQVVNAGAISNKGIELMLQGTPAALENGLRWDVTVNWSTNESEVEELYQDLQTYELGNYWGASTEARVGDPYGSIYGVGYLRDAQSRIIVDEDGFPMIDPERKLLGNYTPDWLASLGTTLTFGDAELGLLFDTRQGGEIFSVTNMFGNYAGVLTTSLRGREESWCEPGIVVEGVTEDGAENTQTICPQDYFGHLYYLDEPHIYDASYTKLREARLGYTIPQEWMAATPFEYARVSLIGRNLLLWTDTPHIDPETAFDAGNSQGFEFGQIPSARSIGLSFTIRP
ncbi:MAG: SusC/RagA family TonB-linked outer membrane protein [Longimicrobiales bacterium]